MHLVAFASHVVNAAFAVTLMNPDALSRQSIRLAQPKRQRTGAVQDLADFSSGLSGRDAS